MKRLAALALVLTGCGTTVHLSAGAPLDRSGTGLASSPAATSSTVPGGPGAGGPATDSGPSGAPAATGPAGSSTDGTSGDAGTVTDAPLAAASGTNGPGVTASTVTIGLTYYQNVAAANAALGASGVNTGDPNAALKLLVKDINAHGGIAGRKVVTLTYAIDPQSSSPYANEAQAECAFFTQDHKVFAVMDGTPAADARRCLNTHNVLVLRGPLVASSLTPNEVDPYTTQIGRAFASLVPALAQQGWFGGWDRVRAQSGSAPARTGIVTVDNPEETRAVDGVLIPALRAAGYAPKDVIRITPPGGFADDGSTVAAIDNAALKLNADGVDHVILDDNNGSLTLLFNSYANSQGYFPRYGGTTADGWQTLLSAGDIQAKTLRGAMGIGWQPLLDLPYQHGDGPESNAARHACLGLFGANGMAASDAATAAGQAEGCDTAYLLPTVMRGYAGPLNAAAFLQRLDALGGSYPLGSGFASRFAPGQHDGNAAYRDLQFSPGCSCMAYSGATQGM